MGVLKWIVWFFINPYVELYKWSNQNARTIIGGIMDPVNKWLWVIIIFMGVLVFSLFKIGGEGRYDMQVMEYSDTHDLVYLLDTKSGEIKAKVHAKSVHIVEKGGEIWADTKWKDVHKEKRRNTYYNNYNAPKNRTPIQRPWPATNN
jgi:hypothetical protein